MDEIVRLGVRIHELSHRERAMLLKLKDGCVGDDEVLE